MDAILSRTDFVTWSHVANSPAKQSWLDRAQMASYFIRPGDVVADLGAGAQTLHQFLPAGATYLPVDCVDDRPNTHVADFNTNDWDLPRSNVVVALGMLNYLENLPGFLARLELVASGRFFIWTYDFWPLKKWFQMHGCRNGIDNIDAGVLVFGQYVSDINLVSVSRRRAMFTGIIIGGGRSSHNPKSEPLSCVQARNMGLLEFAAKKWFGMPMLPRWLS